jgi:SAM-dependent methyltransferase
MELLIGCGNKREKTIRRKEDLAEWTDLITVDIDPNCKPDVVHDLNFIPWPFDDNMFDEVHAYEVMEHLGQQGNWKAFFAHFTEIWRVLKPEGVAYITVPSEFGEWAWGDPGHTRVINRGSLVFLNQEAYEQVGRTSMTDYRHFYKANLVCININTPEEEEKVGCLNFVLQARK